MTEIFRIRASCLAVGAVLAVLAGAVHGATSFPALSRPALQVRAPERQVLLAAAQARQRLVAVGERGLVVLSDDDGISWRQARVVPVSTTLTAVAFADAEHGWAVGHGGVVLHTGDGGATWSRQADGTSLAQAALQAAEQAVRTSAGSAAAQRALKDATALVADGPDKPLLDVYFEDARRGWVVGAYNLAFETSDGGVHWNSISARVDNPKSLHLYAIRAQGQSVYIVGEQGQMQRSVDGGQSFAPLASPYKGSWFALAIESDGAVVAAGMRGSAFRSTDRGDSWQPIAGAPPLSLTSATPLPGGGVLLANQGGQLFTSRAGAAVRALPVPPLPPLNGLLMLNSGALLTLGVGGALRLPAPDYNGTMK
jgi:photosystem II stability/assembly factor-like uncharacterized protein